MPQTKSKKPPNFERALAELETIVQRMEKGEQPLEDALQDFERGAALARICQEHLDRAQQRIDILMKRNGAFTLEPMPKSAAAAKKPARDAE